VTDLDQKTEIHDHMTATQHEQVQQRKDNKNERKDGQQSGMKMNSNNMDVEGNNNTTMEQDGNKKNLVIE
jgi:hypothetical protein